MLVPLRYPLCARRVSSNARLHDKDNVSNVFSKSSNKLQHIDMEILKSIHRGFDYGSIVFLEFGERFTQAVHSGVQRVVSKYRHISITQ